MHPIQARTGGLLVVVGLALAFMVDAGWAMVAGPALLATGGLALALAAQPLVDHAPQQNEVVDAAEPPARNAA